VSCGTKPSFSFKANLEHSLGDRSVYDIHSPHRPASVIPDPLVPIQEIRLYLRIRVSDLDPLEKVREQFGRVQVVVREVLELGLRREGLLDDGVQALRSKVVEPGLRERGQVTTRRIS
jgi:hypothetical protein